MQYVSRLYAFAFSSGDGRRHLCAWPRVSLDIRYCRAAAHAGDRNRSFFALLESRRLNLPFVRRSAASRGVSLCAPTRAHLIKIRRELYVRLDRVQRGQYDRIRDFLIIRLTLVNSIADNELIIDALN